MSGHRKNTGRPLLPAERVERRRTELLRRLAKEGSPSKKIGLASDHLRATITRLPDADADRIATAAIEYLIKLADHAATNPNIK